jgi:hypothetical protein
VSAMKDRDQKKIALQYCVSKRWFPQLEVDVRPARAISRKPALMTDLDVFAAVPDDFVGYRHVVIDCKTLSRESPVNRAFWVRGVVERMGADHGICVLKKNAIEADHKLMANRLGVVLLGEDEFEIYARAMAPRYDTHVGFTANIDSWEAMFAIPTRYPALDSTLRFVRSGYWMDVEAGEACRKTIASLAEVRGELDPSKAEHVALVVDIAALLARALALLSSYLFRAYLHPRSQHDLEEATKMVLYGGRDAYEHRNQLYRLLKERTAGGESSAMELTLPEWPRFVQLIRQLLDSPPASSRAPLILREVAFARLHGATDFTFARSLCKEDPQAGRFAVLILGYVVKAARLPAQFSQDLEPTLIGFLER